MNVVRSRRIRLPEPLPAKQGWLVRDGRVLASLEVARGRLGKARGLLGRDQVEGAMLIVGARSVHSFAMGFDLDVAFLDADNVVIRTLRLHRNRVTVPVWRARYVVEAQAGAFDQWDLNVGQVVELRGCDGKEGSS